MKNNRVKITIGDWSEDGHGKYEEFVFKTNKTVKEIQEAYKQSCKKLGLLFSHKDLTGLGIDWNHPEQYDRSVFAEYESNKLPELAAKILSENGIYVQEEEEYAPEDVCDLMIEVIKLSLPDLVMEEAAFKKSELTDIPAINGWWNEDDDLNEHWGYGVFNDW